MCKCVYIFVSFIGSNRHSPQCFPAFMHVKVGLMNDEGAIHLNDTALCYYKRPDSTRTFNARTHKQTFATCLDELPLKKKKERNSHRERGWEKEREKER